MISDDSTIVASDDLTVADLDGEAVVLDQEEGIYYGLNRVGTRILSLIEEPITVGEIMEFLVEDYPEASREEIRSDLHAFLEKIFEHDLIKVVDGNSAA